MNQQTIQVEPTEENKLQMLRQLRELKKSLKENAKTRADMAWLERKEIDDKLRSANAWEKRRQQKLAAGKKVNIVFVCSRPAVWGLLKPACEAFIDDKRCNIKVVSIPELGAHGAWDATGADYKVNCRVIDGYNSIRKEWFDIKLLEPDYVFFQTPYNILRSGLYHSSIVSSYAKICYTSYGTPVFKGEIEQIANPLDFLQDVFLIFSQTKNYIDNLNKFISGSHLYNGHIVLSGDARVEAIQKLPGNIESPVWKYPRSDKKFRIIWTPRWTQLGNYSSFWDYKDKILELCKQNPDIDLASRPHPLTFSESIFTGHMSAEEVADYKKQYDTLPNAHLDTDAEYQHTFMSSDVLLTDISTIFHDYVATGKPIIYCHREDGFNEHAKFVSQGFYWANNWEEVVALINMLKSGNDPLREKRLQLAKEAYFIPEAGVGNFIKNCILDHFFLNKTPE